MKLSLPISSKLSKRELYVLLQKVAEPNTAVRLQRANQAIGLDFFAEARDDLLAIPQAERSMAVLFNLAYAERKLASSDAELAQAVTRFDELVQADLPANTRIACQLEQASCLRALGQLVEAEHLLRTILSNNPHNSAALRKLVSVLFDQGDPASVLEVTEGLMARGIQGTRVTGSAFVALAALGRQEEAVALRGAERFLHVGLLANSDVGGDLAALHSEIVAELRSHPALRFGNSRQASEDSWRVDELAIRSQPAITRLLEAVTAHVGSYVDGLKAQSKPHPWLAVAPDRARLNAWAIIAPAAGRETWHTHDNGWLSGVYYLTVPDDLPRGEDPAGAIEFGWTDRLLGKEVRASLPSRLVHPEPGTLLMFPSHIHHRTYPHGRDKDRICIAFDVVPGG